MSWKSTESRRQLLLRLKDHVKILMPSTQTRPATLLIGSHVGVSDTVDLLEIILLHGIRVKDFNGMIPLWALLERLEVQTPSCLSLRSAVGAVACIDALHTPLAKARGWLRQSLNSKCLDEALLFMTKEGDKWLRKFYLEDALLMHPDECEALVSVSPPVCES
jgi:hypothetical protein